MISSRMDGIYENRTTGHYRITAIDRLRSAVAKTVNDRVRNYYCNCLE